MFEDALDSTVEIESDDLELLDSEFFPELSDEVDEDSDEEGAYERDDAGFGSYEDDECSVDVEVAEFNF